MEPAARARATKRRRAQQTRDLVRAWNNNPMDPPLLTDRDPAIGINDSLATRLARQRQQRSAQRTSYKASLFNHAALAAALPDVTDACKSSRSSSSSTAPIDVSTEAELRSAVQAGNPWIRLVRSIALQEKDDRQRTQPLRIYDSTQMRISCLPGCALDGSRCAALGTTILVRRAHVALEALVVTGFGVRVFDGSVVSATDCVLEGAFAHWTADSGGQIMIVGGRLTTGEEAYSAVYAGGEGSKIHIEKATVGGGGMHGLMAQFGGEIELVYANGASCVSPSATFEHPYYEAEGEADAAGDGGGSGGAPGGRIVGIPRALVHVGPPQ